MKKIPTLFKRDEVNRGLVTHELTLELPVGAYPTAKWDGTAMLYFPDRGWFARRAVKKGKAKPPGYLEAEFDETTETSFGWEPLTNGPEFKWHRAAIGFTWPDDAEPEPRTYEAVGPHFQGNPHCLEDDMLLPHGASAAVFVFGGGSGYEELRASMEALMFEGVVWWCEGEPVAKLKRRDFGFPWPPRSQGKP